MTTPAGPSTLAETHLATAAENTAGGRRTRAVRAVRQIVTWASWIIAVSARVLVAALTRTVRALPKIIAWACWILAVFVFGLSVAALFVWPGDIGETASAWALSATVLLVSNGVFMLTNHRGKLVRNSLTLLVSLAAIFTAHPALLGGLLAVVGNFVVTGFTLFFLVTAASGDRTLSPRRTTPAA
ncbi:hypothetical protein E3T28_11730 [Cryobacterium sinapicolor]|uniref:Uncharacterized protein n=1 Tax=Cryobacterium sinapicolor TaxID=1259236 RepID=A0ABY2J0L6_9MICO|nr:hypothetical protein [Cryobacterium sinapicolor]TFC97743.1 hypothetical protein E3T28_11730 [Cryobacterium sinapicolor]